MSENRVWAVVRREDSYVCDLCGYRIATMPGEPSMMVELWKIITPKEGGLHDFRVCESCLLTKFADAADPFSLIPRREPGA